MKKILLFSVLSLLMSAGSVFAQDTENDSAVDAVPAADAPAADAVPAADAPAADAAEVQDENRAAPTPAKRMSSEYPKNARRVEFGYMVGAMPTPESIAALKKAGIKLVFTLTYDVKRANGIHKVIEQAGIEHLSIRMGRSFPKLSKFMSTVQKYKPNEIYVHCDHGGDRSGAMIAFFLMKFHNWDRAEAMLTVLNKSNTDLNGLKAVLKEKKIPITQEQIDTYWGIYATVGGGLKGRNDDYKRLLQTTIEAVDL